MDADIARTAREADQIAQKEYEMKQFYESEALKHRQEVKLHQEEVRKHQERVSCVFYCSFFNRVGSELGSGGLGSDFRALSAVKCDVMFWGSS